MSHDGHHSVVIPAPGPEFQAHTVAHHFDTPVQEFQSAKLGFWLFLATEILLFGGLFAAYFYFHEVYPETFRLGGQQLSWKLGALNTSVLLLSSWTMAMGVRCAQTSQKSKLLMYCGLTVLGAAIFMVTSMVLAYISSGGDRAIRDYSEQEKLNAPPPPAEPPPSLPKP